MSERRFTEAQAAEIFRRAAEMEAGSPPALAPSEGLSLSQLQEIGREAGIQPALVARAALDAVSAGAATSTRLLGLPLGVAHTVELDRTLSDAEWERLVAELRTTFDARGTLQYDGPFRQWSNGNLHVLVEPTPRGHRVRFRTSNGLARAMISSGLTSLGAAGGLALLFALLGRLGAAGPLMGVGLFATMGTAMIALGAGRLPLWARLRRQQMRELAEGVATESAALLLPADERENG